MSGHRTRARRLRRWALRCVGPVLFVVLWMTSDLGQARDLIARTRILPIAGAIAMNVAIIVVKAWRWREIMKAQSIDYPYAFAARAYTIACAFAAWTPGRLGDFTKAVSVSRDCKVSFGKAASSVIADRLMDALALTLVAAAGAGLMFGPVMATITWCLVALAAVIGWILFRWASAAGAHRTRAALGKVGLARAGVEMGDALEGLESMARRPSGRRALLAAVPATLAATLITFFQGWLVARSMNLDVSFLRLSAGLGAASIASLLPLSISGIGLREATLVVFLGPDGLGLGEVLTFSVAFLILVNGSAAFFGAVTHALWPQHAPAPDPALGYEAPPGAPRA